MKVCLFHNHDSHLRCNHLRRSLSAWCVLLGWLFAMVFFLTSRCIGDAYLTKKASAHAAMLCVDNMLITLGRSLFNWVYMWVGRAGGDLLVPLEKIRQPVFCLTSCCLWQ